jgi:hypothetical protein
MTTTAVPNNSMRQQLDELDTLLQRMLSLPINQLDEQSVASPPPPPPPRQAAPAPQPQVAFVPQRGAAPAGDGWRPPAMVLLADSGPVAPPVSPEPTFDRGWSINLNPQFGSSVLAPPGPAVAPPPPPAPAWQSEPPAALHVEMPAQTAYAAPAPIPEPPASYRPRRDEPPSPLVAPLVAFNQLFDAVIGLFGPPGRFLCGPVGKNLLGAAGVLMFLGGVALGVLEFNGWSW